MDTADPKRKRGRGVPAKWPRLVIEQVRPAVDGGRAAVKRAVGDAVAVEATIYKDGHDLVAGRIRYRAAGERRWRAAPMTYERDFDRCRGAFTVDRLGDWTFVVDGWTDRFETWRADLRTKAAAGVPVSLDLASGALLVEEAAEAARGADAEALSRHAATLRDAGRAAEARVALGTGPELDALMRRHLPAVDLVTADGEFPVHVDRERARSAPGTSCSRARRRRRRRAHGTFADVERSCRDVAGMGFDVALPAADPPDRRTVPQGAATTRSAAGPDDPGSPWAIGAADRRPHGGPPRARHARGLRRAWSTAPRAHGHRDRARPRLPVLARPSLGERASRVVPAPARRHDPVRREPAEEVRGHLPARLRVRRLARRCGTSCRDVVRFWIEQGVRIFRVDNPHTKPFAFWEWLIARDQARPSRRDLPGRGVHPAEGDAPPGQARLHPVVHLLHLAQHARRS